MNEPAEKAALVAAVAEAHRFIAAATKALENEAVWWWPSATKASAKRASMDLTRALALFRKGGGLA